jgi:hypothetical protein
MTTGRSQEFEALLLGLARSMQSALVPELPPCRSCVCRGPEPRDRALHADDVCGDCNCVLYQSAACLCRCVQIPSISTEQCAVFTPKTRAVLPVDYPAILPILINPRTCRKHGLVVIEDACHALGAGRSWKESGHHHMAVFGFPRWHVATGEGGW